MAAVRVLAHHRCQGWPYGCRWPPGVAEAVDGDDIGMVAASLIMGMDASAGVGMILAAELRP